MAIQISGTTVVNDSRELQNIASLDSTTTSTIQAASSSAMTLVTEGSITSTVAYLDLTLNNHENFVIFLSDFDNNGNSSFVFRWLDSSGNPITTSSYTGYTQAEVFNFYYGESSVMLTVVKPRDSSTRTIAYDGSPEGNSSNPSSTVNYQIWHDNTARQINGLRFFCTNGSHSLTTGKYQVLGIN